MRNSIIIAIVMLLLNSPPGAREITAEELEKWFASDDMQLPVAEATEVNEGELVFLAATPIAKVHHHQNKMIIEPQSLKNGWVKLRQCHNNLDKVARAQILFRKKKIKQLKIISYRNIEQAWIEDNSVQLKNISANAQLCVQAISQALIANQDGSYSLRNGPFMRRFLDGYYPMHVTMDVLFSGTGLQLSSSSPVSQQGFQVWQKSEQVGYEAWFEGRLNTELRFQPATL
ncbi:MAG: alpha/beta hydrolase [Thioalkalispiraceae bacterium]